MARQQLPVEVGEVEAARLRLGPHVRTTPLLASAGLGELAGCELLLKLECHQHTGSFKVRGALNRILQLTPEERSRGIAAASAGNHALGVAWAAGIAGIREAHLFVQGNASRAKLAKLRRYPVHLHLVGETYEAAEAAALEHVEKRGAVYVPAYDHPQVIAGQGTCGLEIVEQAARLDTVVVPIGGGALVAGIALAVKARRPGCRIVGVNPEASPSALRSLEEGTALDPFEHGPTRAHGLAGGFGRAPFAIVRELVDEVVLVSEEQMALAIAALVDHEQVLAEPSGAAGLGAVLGGRVPGVSGRSVAVVISGGNIDARTLGEVLQAVRGPG